MVNVLVLLSTLTLSTSPNANAPCKWVGELVSSSSNALDASTFTVISSSMSAADVLKRIGPASRELGSGVYILEWDVSDGRVFSLSASSLCAKPLSIGFQKRGP